ncbi:hypothetical protein [Haloplanus halophilus]|uniref:hypothetical protein n=1 Tax=Haloplanus halophilus TaxID=2949993 RepID=UPI00203E3353|nr:hypothetical protein [Haloplanus sp. GDY1]
MEGPAWRPTERTAGGRLARTPLAAPLTVVAVRSPGRGAGTTGLLALGFGLDAVTRARGPNAALGADATDG